MTLTADFIMHCVVVTFEEIDLQDCDALFALSLVYSCKHRLLLTALKCDFDETSRLNVQFCRQKISLRCTGRNRHNCNV